VSKETNIPDEFICSKIYQLRGQKVMLDRDLADLYLAAIDLYNIFKTTGIIVYSLTTNILWKFQFQYY
jgi:hypothetical protein